MIILVTMIHYDNNNDNDNNDNDNDNIHPFGITPAKLRGAR